MNQRFLLIVLLVKNCTYSFVNFSSPLKFKSETFLSYCIIDRFQCSLLAASSLILQEQGKCSVGLISRRKELVPLSTVCLLCL